MVDHKYLDWNIINYPQYYLNITNDIKLNTPKYSILPDADKIKVWAVLFLSYALDELDNNDDKFLIVDNAYAELNYPDFMKGVVTYMPAEDENPSADNLLKRIMNLREKLAMETLITR
jgi:hypothetical protein